MTFDEAIYEAENELIYDDNTVGVWTMLLKQLKDKYDTDKQIVNDTQNDNLEGATRNIINDSDKTNDWEERYYYGDKD